MRHLALNNPLGKLLTPLCLPVLLFSFAARLAAQQTCMPPGLAQQLSSQNIFSERQEMDLGDAVAEHLQRDYKVIEDEEVTARLRQIADRIIKNLPPTELKFQLYLFDINGVNAHELGHIVARHATVDMKILFREILGVTQVTDRRDIFEKYNRLIESMRLKPKVFEKLDNHEEGEQGVADLVGLFAMA